AGAARPFRGSWTPAHVLKAGSVHPTGRAGPTRRKVAQRAAERRCLLQADGSVAEAQPAPERDDRAERHLAEVAPRLDRSAVACHSTLPQPVLRSEAYARSIQAPGSHRTWLHAPAPLRL